MRNLLVLMAAIALIVNACNVDCHRKRNQKWPENVKNGVKKQQVSKFHLNGIWSRIGKRNGQNMEYLNNSNNKHHQILDRFKQHNQFY